MITIKEACECAAPKPSALKGGPCQACRKPLPHVPYKAKPIHPAYPLMLAESAALAMPQRFRADLTKHDRKWLSTRDPAAPFLWNLRDGGTHLIALDWSGELDGRGKSCAAWPKALASTFSGEQRFYVWDGVALIPFFADFQACAARIEEMIERSKAEKAERATP